MDKWEDTVMSDEQLIEDMVTRYRKWDARGTPDPVIMGKILANIKPIIFKAGEEAKDVHNPDNLTCMCRDCIFNKGLKIGEDKGKQEGFDEVVEWIQKNHVELIPYGEPAICILTSDYQAFRKERGK